MIISNLFLYFLEAESNGARDFLVVEYVLGTPYYYGSFTNSRITDENDFEFGGFSTLSLHVSSLFYLNKTKMFSTID